MAPVSRSESGFALVEVIVSAAVLAIVALAVLSGIDAANGSTAREKARAVAASLAEQDQERLRSMSTETLKTLNETKTVDVGNATYTVKSEAVFITDDQGGTPACGNSTTKSEYFKISSTVTSTIVGQRIPAVKIDSLTSPSVAYSQTHGTLGVRVVDRNGNGLEGVSVAGSGAQALTTQTTDPKGCVIWRSIKIGTYTVTVDKVTYGTEDGSNPVVRQQTVSPNTVSFVNIAYDVLGSSLVSIKTHIPGSTPTGANIKPSTSRTVANTSGADRTWPIPAGANAVRADKLFPFVKSSYGFFTGACGYQSPEQVVNADYFKTINSAASVLVGPGAIDLPATVYQPPVAIRVTRSYYNNSSVPAAGKVEVWLTPVNTSTGDDCADAKYVFATATWPNPGWGTASPAGQAGWASNASSTTFDPGLPFGTYSVCLVDKTSTPYRYHAYTALTGRQYTNTTVNGVSPTSAPWNNLNPTGSSNWPSTPPASCS